MSARSESVVNQKIDYCAIKVEVDFVESVVYVRRDQKSKIIAAAWLIFSSNSHKCFPYFPPLNKICFFTLTLKRLIQ